MSNNDPCLMVGGGPVRLTTALQMSRHVSRAHKRESTEGACRSRLACHLALNDLMLRITLTTVFLFTGIATCHAGDAKKGADVAIEHCRRCHVIPGQNNMGIGISPSFKSMVQSPAQDWRHKFEVFYALRPHPSFVIIREFRTTPEFPVGITPVIIAVDDLGHLIPKELTIDPFDNLAQEFRK